MYKRAILLSSLLAIASTLSAESVSYTGTLATADDIFQTTFNVASAGPVTIQTWGFGGGTNAAGATIAAGGFDPLIALFSGSSASAPIVIDGSGDPLADSDNLYNPPWSYVGNCPAAGSVIVGDSSGCGDVFLQASLAAGTYTLLLSDANNIPFAVYDDGTLDEGFVDFTPGPGLFQTCNADGSGCITPNGNYAVDIITPDSGLPMSATPDPSTFTLFGTGLAALAGARRYRRTRPIRN